MTMNRAGRTSMLSAGIATLALLSACGGGGGTDPQSSESLADMEPVTLSLADFNPEATIGGEAFKVMMNYVEEETDGAVTFEPYWAASLVAPDDMLSGVGDGVADIGHVIPTYFPQDLPVTNWMQLAASNASPSFPTGFLQGMVSSQEFAVNNEASVAEYAEQNLVPLLGYSSGQNYEMMCTEQVDGLSDAEGLLNRVTGLALTGETEAMGMRAVNLAGSEVYEGLQRGVIDCEAVVVPYQIDLGYWEVADYFLPVPLTVPNELAFVINKDVWDSFPDEVKEIFRAAAHEAWLSMVSATFEKYAQFATEGVEDQGVQFLDTEELDQVVLAHQEETRAAMAADAPAGVDKPEELLAGYWAGQDEWLSLLNDELQIPSSENTPDELIEAYTNSPDIDLRDFADRTRPLFMDAPGS
jgi:TRAP-type C4-dicarboxylate transport system substrate-binding protein